MHKNKICKGEVVQVNGRTLKTALTRAHLAADARQYSATEWVSFCLNCQANELARLGAGAPPFLCHDGVMRAVQDYDALIGRFIGPTLEFAGFKFSRAALDIAHSTFELPSGMTRQVEEMGRAIAKGSSARRLLEFGEAVCKWGRGNRVWANVLRHHNAKVLSNLYAQWFDQVRVAQSDEQALALGIEIKGLGVSFASKHLRLMQPARYAVLDAVLSDGLGFALNAKGYALFMRELRSFSNGGNFELSIAQLEGAIFNLVRQKVRALDSPRSR